MRIRDAVKHPALLVSFVLYLLVLIRTAWVCDDAFITFRTCDNFVHGFGLTWNTVERAQTYTHPLWMFVFSAVYAVTHEAFFTAIFLSLAVSLAAAATFVLRIAPDAVSATLGMAVLFLSRSYVDYSSSGLENPLSHLLLLGFLVVYLRPGADLRRLLLLSLIAAAGALNRLDSILIFLPLLGYALLPLPKLKGLGMLALGFLPLFLWELFSLFYYGFLLPNTAYAKLSTGIGTGELIGRGFAYLLSSLRNDPLTLVVILTGMVLPWLRKEARFRPLALGISLHLLYLVKIGGDFMSGRFLSLPLLAAVCLLPLIDLSSLKRLIPAGAAVALLGLISPYPPLFCGSDYGKDRGGEQRVIQYPGGQGHFWTLPAGFIDKYGVADERGFYYRYSGLLRAGRGRPMPTIWWADRGRAARGQQTPLVRHGNVGYLGYFAGPDVYVLDSLAITDPFLSRLPARADPNWRPGHFTRLLPDGYQQTRSSGQNQLSDPRLVAFYDSLSLITQGELFDSDRLIEIAKMNTGAYDELVDRSYFRFPYQAEVELSAVSAAKSPGTPWDQAGNQVFHEKGLRIRIGSTQHAARIEASLDSNDVYLIALLNSQGDSATVLLPEDTPLAPGIQLTTPRKSSIGLVQYVFDVPSPMTRDGYDELRVLPLAGDGNYAVGHVRLVE